MNNKKAYYEFMRILACGLVIFCHIDGYWLFCMSTGWKQILFSSLTVIDRIHVPLFLMISGALLFRKNEEWGVVFKKRFLRILLLILISNLVLLACNKLNAVWTGNEYEISLTKYIYGTLGNKVDNGYPYWYLYAYLGMIFVLPMLQRMAKGMTKSEFIALVTLHFIVFSLMPVINTFMTEAGLVNVDINFSVPFAFEKALFYPLVGYYLDAKIDIESLKGRRIIWLLLAGGIVVAVSDCMVYYGLNLYTQWSKIEQFVLLFDYLIAIIVFLLIKYLFLVAASDLEEGKTARILCLVGSLTLGIYVLDPCLKLIMYDRYEALTMPVLPGIIVYIGWVLCSMIIGGFVTYILKKYTILRQVL